MEVQNLPVSKIVGAAFTMRESDEPSKGLVGSIKKTGILEPLLVRPKASKYEIIAGSRRFKAALLLGLKDVPASIRKLNDQEAFEIALTDNIQRENLSPIEEAKAFLQYIDVKGWGSIPELADRINKEPRYVIERLRLLDLPPNVLEQISRYRFRVRLPRGARRHALSPSMARIITHLPEGHREEFAREATAKGLCIEDARRAAALIRKDELSAKEAVQKIMSIMFARIFVKRVVWADLKRIATIRNISIEDLAGEALEEYVSAHR